MMNRKNESGRISFLKKSNFALLMGLAIFVSGCKSGGIQTGGSIEMSATTGISSANIQPTPFPQQPDPFNIPSTNPTFHRGVYFTQNDPQTIHRFIDRAGDMGITQIYLGGDYIPALDTLILDESRLASLQEIITHSTNMGLRQYLSIQEIALNPSISRLGIESPLIVARQSACRNALKRAPGLEGIVLRFEKTPLDPQEFTTPITNVHSTQESDVAFAIEMMKTVVVDEFGKELIVSVSGAGPEVQAQALRAVREMNSRLVTLMAGSAKSGQGGEWIEFDLTGQNEGAEQLVYGVPGLVMDQWKASQRDSIQGVIAKVDYRGGSILGSVNEINLDAFSKIAPGVAVLHPTLWEEWTQKHFDVLPISDEGRFLISLCHDAESIRTSIHQLLDWHRFEIRGDGEPKISQSKWIDGKAADTRVSSYMASKILQPDTQTIFDAAQENYETENKLTKLIEQFDQFMVSRLARTTYQDLRGRLERLRWVCQMIASCKQAHLEYSNWAKTYNESAALDLELQLRRLETLLARGEGLFEAGAMPMDQAAIAKYVHSLRASFPRVLLGARELDWNRIEEVSFIPAGTDALDVQWTTEEPSLSRVYVSSKPPVFDRILSPGIVPGQIHRMRITDLKPGEAYFIKLQCINRNGLLTNSKAHRIQMDSQLAL